MAPLVAAGPASRVLRGWDGFEVAARSVIGQQVTVAQARRLNGILVDRCGSELPAGADEGLSRVFPTPQRVLDADLSAMGMPGARVATLKTVASAVLAEPRLFDPAGFIDETIARLRAIRGIGDLDGSLIAMCACGEPDAFPASDVGLLRGAADATGHRPTPSSCWHEPKRGARGARMRRINCGPAMRAASGAWSHGRECHEHGNRDETDQRGGY